MAARSEHSNVVAGYIPRQDWHCAGFYWAASLRLPLGAAYLLDRNSPLQDALVHGLQALFLCFASRQHLQCVHSVMASAG